MHLMRGHRSIALSCRTFIYSLVAARQDRMRIANELTTRCQHN